MAMTTPASPSPAIPPAPMAPPKAAIQAGFLRLMAHMSIEPKKMVKQYPYGTNIATPRPIADGIQRFTAARGDTTLNNPGGAASLALKFYQRSCAIGIEAYGEDPTHQCTVVKLEQGIGHAIGL